MTSGRRFKDVLAESLRNPQVRAEWDRSALARGVSIWLLRYRKDHNLTQSDLAEILGWKQPAVARLESGEHEPSVSTLHHLIERLGSRARIEIEPEGIALRFLRRSRRSHPVHVAEVQLKRRTAQRPSVQIVEPVSLA